MTWAHRPIACQYRDWKHRQEGGFKTLVRVAAVGYAAFLVAFMLVQVRADW